LHQSLKTLAPLLEGLESSSERGIIEDEQRAALHKLEGAMAQLGSERLRRGADAVRAARIQVEIVGSDAVARKALAINEKLYELLGSMSNPDGAAKAELLIGDIRAARFPLLDAAKCDVQLLG
jgi:hypothetical protein